MMFSPDALESEIRVTMNRMDAISSRIIRIEISQSENANHQELPLLALQWKALDRYKTTLEMHLNMLKENE